MMKGIVHTRVASTILIVVCIIVSASIAGYLLDLYNTGSVSANQPPVADAGENIVGYPTAPVTFNASASSDVDGEIISYDWDFGDGYTGIGMKPTHTYDLAGTYPVVLTVTDNDGATAQDFATAEIVEDPEGTGMYQLLTVNEILTNGTQYYGKLVRVAYATVADAGSFNKGYGSDPSGWVNFEISDKTTNDPLTIYCEGDATRPLELSDGDIVNVSGILEKYSGDWELKVRKNTADKVVLCPAIYTQYTLGQLLSDRLAHFGELVRIVEAEILAKWSAGWDVTDNTTTEQVSLYVEIGANVSTYINTSDRVTIQAVFTYYDSNKDGVPDPEEWELKVRDTADDKVERTFEFDYPPAVISVSRNIASPSPYQNVTVNATASDNLAVTGVQLHYSLNGTAQTALQMTNVVADNYTAQIPAMSNGTNVSYFVRAFDNLGQFGDSNVSYYISTDKPPTIIEARHEPDFINPDVNVTIIANVTDDGGISSVSVVYSADEWASQTVADMKDDGLAPDLVAGDLEFRIDLGKFSDNTTVEYFVSVKDSIGQNMTSENLTFISSYDQPPRFGGIYRDIEMPSETQDVTIIANVTDDLQLVSVTLFYNISTGDYNVAMTQRADGNWVGVIPSLPKATVVNYYVNASDNGTHVVKYPVSGTYSYKVGHFNSKALFATGHGEYKYGMDNFKKLVAQKNLEYVEDDLNNVNLDEFEFVIINDPSEQYLTSELDTLESYIQNGGGLLLLCETDYDDYGKPENCNPILSHLGITGRFNDDSYKDDWYNYAGSPHIPYFNWYDNDTSTYWEEYCFENDTTSIAHDLPLSLGWLEATSVCSLYNTGNDIIVVQGSENGGYNTDTTPGELYVPYTFGNSPPIVAANVSLGNGRIIYGGFGTTIRGRSYYVAGENYFGWLETNISVFFSNMIDWLVSTPLLLTPGIIDVVQTPSEPTDTESVTIAATVNPLNGTASISSVTLHYSVNGSYYKSVPMALNAGKYQATISNQKAGAAVTYYIRTMDIDNNFGFFPKNPLTTGIEWYIVTGGEIDHLVISEVSYNPQGTDSGLEFLELYNPFPVALSLEGWMVQSQNGYNNYTDPWPDLIPIPWKSFIPAYGYFLVAQQEYQDWGGDFIMSSSDWVMQNGPSSSTDRFGDCVRLIDPAGNVIDTVCWDDEYLDGLNITMYEGWPFPDPGCINGGTASDEGSIERLPGLDDLFGGNYIDTNNNSRDFQYRGISDPQNSSSLPEYPPWAANVTSPIPLPPDHPKYMAANAQPIVNQAAVCAPEPMEQEISAELQPERTTFSEPQNSETSQQMPGISIELSFVPFVPLLLIPRRRVFGR